MRVGVRRQTAHLQITTAVQAPLIAQSEVFAVLAA
jgi:hypothetical protein